MDGKTNGTPCTTTSTTQDPAPSPADLLAQEGARVRDSGLFARSDRLIRLFDFILARSCANVSPKEIEIAWEVLDLRDTDAADNGAVRVHVHRLRRKLDEYYGDMAGPRLQLPRGQYRLFYGTEPVAAVEPPAASKLPDTLVDTPAAGAAPERPRSRYLLGAMLLLAAINLTGWLAWLMLPAMRPVGGAAATPFWHALAASGRQTSLVVGDYYMFGEGPTSTGITRILRDFSINSRDDLFLHLMDHPDRRQDYVDLDMHYVPVGVVSAVSEIIQFARGSGVARAAAWPEMPVSSLTPASLKSTNVVYVGFINDLGLLGKVIAQAGGVTISAADNALLDPATGRRYQAAWQLPADMTVPRRDYGYIASLPGPNGNRILVIAGTRDPAVLQAAEAIMNKAVLHRLADMTSQAASFEALFDVTTLGNTDLRSSLLFAHPLTGQPRRPESR